MPTEEMEQVLLDTSWLNGKYSWVEDNYGDKRTIEAEIRGMYSTLAIGDFFVQGETADRYIDEIHHIWVSSGTLDQEEAIRKWAFDNDIDY